MRSEEEFSIISCVIVVDGVLCAELYALDLLKIYVVNTLSSADSTAVLETFPCFLDGFAQFTVEKLNEMLSADEAQEKYAVVSGERPAPKKYLIGEKETSLGYEALVLRKDIPSLGNVSVRTPNYEDILVHTILRNRENRK